MNEKILILKIPENYCNSQIRAILMIFFQMKCSFAESKGQHRFRLLSLPDSIIKDETCKEERTFSLCSLWMLSSLKTQMCFFVWFFFISYLATSILMQKKKKGKR